MRSDLKNYQMGSNLNPNRHGAANVQDQSQQEYTLNISDFFSKNTFENVYQEESLSV